MTREEKLFDAVTRIPNDLVEEAAAPCGRRPKKWIRYAAAAAACAAVVLAVPRLMGPMGSNGTVDTAGGGAGHDEGTVFLSYAGPVFPLDVTDNTGLTAAREITLDLSGEAMAVTDRYTLANTTGADRTTTLLYPFAGSLRTLEEQLPALTVEGMPVKTVLYQGGYAGGFRDAGDGSTAERHNLSQPVQWCQYGELLADGSYQRWALAGEAPLDIPVTVYRFDGAATAATYRPGEGSSVVLTYGFEGYTWREKTGEAVYYYHSGGSDRLHLLILVGGQPEDAGLKGWKADGTGLPGVTRQETTLEALLLEMAEEEMATARRFGYAQGVTAEQLCRAAGDILTRYGLLSEEVAERYALGRLDDLFVDALGQKRVFYLAAEVTVPAGESLTVEAALDKAPSFDYACAHTENQGIEGYDLVTEVGSDLTFTAQTATLTGWEQVDIVRQNFGFEPELGVTEAPLTEEHYYLEVRKKSQ